VADRYPGSAGIPRVDHEEAALEASQVERGCQASRTTAHDQAVEKLVEVYRPRLGHSLIRAGGELP
jgi:hypothetical protein